MDPLTPEQYEAHERVLADLIPLDLGDGIHRAGWEVAGAPLPDGGHGFTVAATHAQDSDLVWLHTCREGRRALGRIDVTSGQRHKLVTPDPVTLEGSIRCPVCGDHGFIEEGRWRAA